MTNTRLAAALIWLAMLGLIFAASIMWRMQ